MYTNPKHAQIRMYIYIDILYSFDIYPTFLVTFMIAIFRGLSTDNPGKRSADPFLWRQWTLPAWASNGGRKWRRFVEGDATIWAWMRVEPPWAEFQ